jgi:hypothetical protein
MSRLTTVPARRRAAAVLLASLLFASPAPGAPGEERRPATRNTTRTSINSVNRTNVNVNAVKDTNVNVNVNTVRRADVDVHVHGGYYYNPGPSVGAVVATAIVVGTIVATLPPSCTTVIANGFTYHNCGGTFYQPRYSGSTVTYVVVVKP